MVKVKPLTSAWQCHQNEQDGQQDDQFVKGFDLFAFGRCCVKFEALLFDFIDKQCVYHYDCEERYERIYK